MSEHAEKSTLLDGISGIVRKAFGSAFPNRTQLSIQDLDRMLAGSILNDIQTHGEKLVAIAKTLPEKPSKAEGSNNLNGFCHALKTFADAVDASPEVAGKMTVASEHLANLIAEKPAVDRYILDQIKHGEDNMLVGTNVMEAAYLSKALSAIAKKIAGHGNDSQSIKIIHGILPARIAPYQDVCQWFGDGAVLIGTLKRSSQLRTAGYLVDNAAPNARPN